MKNKNIYFRKYTLISAAAITVALILLLLETYMQNDRARTLHRAMQTVDGEPLVFSKDSGFYTEGFTLKLGRDPAIPEDVEIRYTTDGDEPTSESLLYEGGIDLAALAEAALQERRAETAKTEKVLEMERASAAETGMEDGDSSDGDAEGDDSAGDRSGAVPTIDENREMWRREMAAAASDKGVIPRAAEDGISVIPVRARLIQGEDKSDVVTRTYVIGRDVFSRYGAWVVCLSTDAANLFDYENGFMIRGSHYQEDIDSGTRVDRSGNYFHTGDDWVRDAHVTLLSPDGQVLLEEEGGLSVTGFSSRNLPNRSLRLEASTDRGSRDKYFQLDLFSGDSCYGILPLQEEAGSGSTGGGEEEEEEEKEKETAEDPVGTAFRKLKFRSHGVPQYHMRAVRSQYAKILTDQCGFPGLAENRLGAVYLNGEFYTICDITPSVDREYMCRLFGLGVPDAIDKYEGNDYNVFTQAGIVKLLETDLTQEENQARLEEKVDMNNYLFYYALEVLMNNSDWPFNNILMWRYLGEADPENPYSDGRFRFVLDDMDHILTNDLHSMPEHWSTEVFDYLMKDEKSTFHHVMECSRYRDMFLTYVDDLLQTAFAPDPDCEILDSLYAQMEKEYRMDYGDDFWQEMVETAEITKKNVREKEPMLRADIEKYLGLKDRYSVRIEAGEGTEISWNNVTLQAGEAMDSEHYCGTAFEITAEPAEGYHIVGWEINGVLTETEDKETGERKAAVLTVSDALCKDEADPAGKAEAGRAANAADTGEGAGAEAPALTVRAVAEPDR